MPDVGRAARRRQLRRQCAVGASSRSKWRACQKRLWIGKAIESRASRWTKLESMPGRVAEPPRHAPSASGRIRQIFGAHAQLRSRRGSTGICALQGLSVPRRRESVGSCDRELCVKGVEGVPSRGHLLHFPGGLQVTSLEEDLVRAGRSVVADAPLGRRGGFPEPGRPRLARMGGDAWLESTAAASLQQLLQHGADPARRHA